MRPLNKHRIVVPILAVLSMLVAAPAAASERTSQQPAGVSATLDGVARQVADLLPRADFRDSLTSSLAAGPVELSALAQTALGARTAGADHAVRQAKGLPESVGSVIQLRLATDGMRAALASGTAPLVAAEPSDDAVTQIRAYDVGGERVLLDAAQVPTRPVILVEVDVAKVMPAGLQVMRDIMARGGSRAAGSTSTTALATTASTSGGYWATQVKAVWLSDDKEPWFKGAAEIFSIVGGFDLNGQATVNIVDMPYLDYDHTTYYPNQLLVHFFRYKYDLADVVMMEDDGDTNYQSLALAITDALLTITDQGAYIPLVNAILNAIPTSWWTDDPDYVDSWYTLSTTSNGRLYGAAGNGWMDVSPYWVSTL